ncbi:DUF2267 domain-containing protein [Rhizomonospora bruguierae]|uniref:DUF2267 domain-containing protein n=1 Tax=Rhizomonospora bruguierae TaxID=1581705 RepID=UPI001BCF8B27|nr:DUF2267 domain-containing protein [Micromonospora sp. NBRC 107566]
MTAKKREGDEQRRARLARDARERGVTPSASGATLGSSKQVEHRDGARRGGPPTDAGQRKRTPDQPIPASPPRPVRTAPKWDPEAVGAAGPGGLNYRDVITEVGRRAGLDFERARAATTATVTTLARIVAQPERELLLDSVPPGLYGDGTDDPLDGRPDLTRFVSEVGRSAGEPPEEALYQAQTVLRILDERDAALIDALHLPADIRGLTGAEPAGGGVSGPTGQTAPLTDGEVSAALAALPYWTREGSALCRTLSLPRANLDRVIQRLAALHRDEGRGPHIGRVDEGTVTLAVRTSRVDAITRRDIDLARRVDAVIDEVGAGIA